VEVARAQHGGFGHEAGSQATPVLGQKP